MSTQSQRSFERSLEEESTDSFERLPKDQIFHLLQTQRRRDALRYLKHHDNPVEMRALAEQVAAWENDTTVAKLTSAERQRVYIALYQSHLPKLDEKGIIEYNQSRGVVERAARAERFDPYLEAESNRDEDPTATMAPRMDSPSVPSTRNVRWDRQYRRAGLVSALVLAGALLPVYPLSLISTYVWGIVVVGLFTLLSTAQFVHGRTSP